MNIHEHQAKDLLRKYGAPVSNGVVILNKDEIEEKTKKLKSKEFVVKAQIHAGGRGKAGGVKLVKDLQLLSGQISEMFGKTLVTPQTGAQGKIVKRVYVEEASDIKKELYLSCVVDRTSSKLAFISSVAGGMDIEKVAEENPEKIITTKVGFDEKISKKNANQILKPYNLDENQINKSTLNSDYLTDYPLCQGGRWFRPPAKYRYKGRYY